MIKTIFIDMDGVLCDFIRGAHKHLMPYSDLDVMEKLYSSWPAGEYNFAKVFKIPENEVWEALNASSEFWSELRAYPWWLSLCSMCRDIAPTFITTSPANHPNCAAGKVSWIHSMFGLDFKDYIFTSKKELLANNTAVLIDDSEANCVKFVEAGGSAILFPAPWNTASKDRSDPLYHAENQLNTINSRTIYENN